MVELELTISAKLKQLLPPLSEEAAKQLEENIVNDGRVRDPILYWHHGGKNLVVDGMNRYAVAKKKGVPYRCEPMEFSSMEQCERWIRANQFGRRNLTPEQLRIVRGQYYNDIKQHGGDRKSEPGSSDQIERLIPHNGKELAEKSGVSIATVRRDGKYVESLNKLAAPVKKAVEEKRLPVNDEQLHALAKLEPTKQQAVAREVRTAAKPTTEVVTEALKHNGAAMKEKKNKAPKCEHSWVADGNGERYCEHCKEDHPDNGKNGKEQLTTQRQKTVKTVEALMRAFDDLNDLLPKSAHKNAIRVCKELLETAKAWK